MGDESDDALKTPNLGLLHALFGGIELALLALRDTRCNRFGQPLSPLADACGHHKR